MDPSIYLQYTPVSPPNGLPQESKLATYMNRNATTPTRSITQGLSKVSLESSPTAIKKVVLGEYVPLNYFSPASMLPESPESSPPNTLGMPTNHLAQPQVHQVNTYQENVGGTTYFYSTNTDGLNSAVAHNATMGVPETCMGPGVGPSGASPYASQIYSNASTHMAAMSSKSGVPDPCMGVSAVSPYASQIYSTPSHMSPMTSKPGLAASFYMPETIRAELFQANDDLVFLQPDPHLPDSVEMYGELTPLEPASPHGLASVFRGTHRQCGEHYALRRVHAPANLHAKRMDLWRQIDHPNIVRLHEAFVTTAFGDHSVVLVYEYHPASMTLMSKYLAGGAGGSVNDSSSAFHDPFSNDPDAPRPYTHQKNAMLRAVASGALLPEAVLWSLLVQLTAALRAIHTAGLACRTLDPTKVVMSGCRVRIAWCGAADALHANTNDIVQAQQEDLTALGRLALALACRTVHCDNLPASIELVARTYSADLKNLILYLLSTGTARRSVTDLMPMIGARFYTQVEALERRADVVEHQLAREIDNGRLLRILIKLGVVNERPELNMEASWAETGDRYMLKLFRDYLFHSVSSDGQPWLDYTHLVHCLNQLDAGSVNRVELMSRDEQSVLVVSYSELKHCLEQAFAEVMTAASRT